MGLVLLGPSAFLFALYGSVALLWAGLFVIKGPAHKPGPKLQGPTRAFHIWSHRGLYILTLAAGLCAVAQLFGVNAPVRPLLLALLAGGALHAVFHLWRHTTLMDGALKLILPKAVHGIL